MRKKRVGGESLKLGNGGTPHEIFYRQKRGVGGQPRKNVVTAAAASAITRGASKRGLPGGK